MPHAVVLGAGIIGLQPAIYLLEAGYRVTVLAAHLPGDVDARYTSPWAGAHWRTHASADDERQRRWDLETYEEWMKQIASARTVKDRAALGLKVYDSHSYWDRTPTSTLWWAPHVQSYGTLPCPSTATQAIERTSSTPSPIACAATFRSIAVDVPRYLLRLRDQIHSLGGTFIRTTLHPGSSLDATLTTAAALVRRVTSLVPDVFVNATGLGAAKLCRDDTCYPVRGQTVLVRGEADAIRTRLGDGYISYVIPRPGSGTSVVGGTKEKGDWDPRVREETSGEILQRAMGLAPELLTGEGGGWEVVGSQVGFRPGRSGGARVEVERTGRWRVVHAYGVEGAGYQNSVGVGREVVELVGGVLREDEGKEARRAKL